jgi:predicted metal-dependent phosphoesterase TrpH
MKYADLHLHTIFSDGTYTPAQLISDALNCSLSAISIVDHDTVEGVAPAVEIGDKEGLEVIPGIELTAEYEGLEIHILGYLLDYKNKELRERIKVLQKNRVERVYKIVEKLKESGLNLDADKVFDISRQGSVGRLHIARAMVRAGLVGSIFEAFRKYIGDKGPAYVLGFKMSPQEAISLIKRSGGIPVLAHPYSLNSDELIPLFVEYGIMGLEVHYPEHSQSMVNFYLGLAKRYNLLVTGGSDCHGEAKPEIRIGSIKIPYELVEKLKAAKESLV